MVALSFALRRQASLPAGRYDSQMVDLRASIADTDAEIEADTNTKTDTTGEKDATLESGAEPVINANERMSRKGSMHGAGWLWWLW